MYEGKVGFPGNRLPNPPKTLTLCYIMPVSVRIQIVIFRNHLGVFGRGSRGKTLSKGFSPASALESHFSSTSGALTNRLHERKQSCLIHFKKNSIRSARPFSRPGTNKENGESRIKPALIAHTVVSTRKRKLSRFNVWVPVNP